MSTKARVQSMLAALVFLLFLAPPFFSQYPNAKRDLTRYAKGGEFFLRHWYGEMWDDEEKAKARVREFLWKSWRAKKLAHCSIVIGYTHGDSLHTNYYVEPDREGRWLIAVERVKSCCALEVLTATMQGQRKELEHQTESVGSYRIIRRVETKSGRPLPEKAKRKPETYTLLLEADQPPKTTTGDIGRSQTLKL